MRVTGKEILKHTELKYVFENTIGLYLLKNKKDIPEVIEDKDDFLEKKLLIYCFPLKTEGMRRKKLDISLSYEIFFDSDFVYDPFLVAPLHKLLTKKEMNEHERKNDFVNMPKIYESDIIARYFHAKPNQVFEINEGERFLHVIKDI